VTQRHPHPPHQCKSRQVMIPALGTEKCETAAGTHMFCTVLAVKKSNRSHQWHPNMTASMHRFSNVLHVEMSNRNCQLLVNMTTGVQSFHTVLIVKTSNRNY
jgi:hypothetical protein